MNNEETNNVYQIGSHIKKVRKEKKMTMNDLAMRVGLSQSAISMIENNIRHPTLATLNKFSEALDFDFSKLLSSQTNSIENTTSVNLELSAVDFQMSFSIKEFKSEINDDEINNAVQNTFIHYLQQLLSNENVKIGIEKEIKKTIKETLDKKQFELQKLYEKISEE